MNVQRVAFGLGEPPTPDKPWRVVIALYGERGKPPAYIKLAQGTREQCAATLAEIRADVLGTLEDLQRAGLLPPGPLSKYLHDIQ